MRKKKPVPAKIKADKKIGEPNKEKDSKFKLALLGALYVILPIAITLIVFKIKPAILGALSKTAVGEGWVYNSSDTIVEYIAPFVSSFLLLLCVAVSFLLLSIISKALSKKKIYLHGKETILLCVEVVTIILSSFVLIYQHDIGFNYWEYGINTKRLVEGGMFCPLELIPRLSSQGIISSDSTILYRTTLWLARFSHACIENLDLYLAILSALIIPLKIKRTDN